MHCCLSRSNLYFELIQKTASPSSPILLLLFLAEILLLVSLLFFLFFPVTESWEYAFYSKKDFKNSQKKKKEQLCESISPSLLVRYHMESMGDLL